MELFGYIGWITVPEYIVDLVLRYGNISTETFAESIALSRLCYWIILGVGLGLFFIGVIFGGFGLMKLAKRAGIKHGWMGFFPFANTYLTGKLAGETYVFNSRVKRIGLWTTVCEVLFVALNIFGYVLQMLLMRAEYFVPVTNSLGEVDYEISEAMIPAGLRWLTTANLAVYIIEMIFSFVVLFMFCTMFFAFYRKYYARSPFLMTFLSAVLPGRGFAIFAVRNNTPVDYGAYVRRRMQQQYEQQYGQQYGQPPYDGYYGDGSTPSQPSHPMPPDEPFGDEFGSAPRGGSSGGTTQGNPPPSDDDPFSDF